MTLSSVPTTDLLQIAAVLRPAQLIGCAQRMDIIVAVACVIAVSTSQQTQSADPATPPKSSGERIHPAIARTGEIDATTLIRTEEPAGAGPADLRAFGMVSQLVNERADA